MSLTRSQTFSMRRISAVLFALLALCAPALAWEGQLVDPSGEPVAGARITPIGESGGVLTDAEGRFTIAAPRPINLLVELATGQTLVVRADAEGHTAVLVADPALSEEVVATAPVASELVAPPGAQPWRLDAEEASARGDTSLQQTLAELPGSEPRSPDPDRVPVFRGMADGRTLFLVDESVLGNERRAGVSGGGMHPATWGELEVLRGPGAIVYGSGAIGGVILVRSPWAAPRGERGFAVEIEGGGGDVEGNSAGVRYEEDGWSLALGVRDVDDPVSRDGEAIRASYEQQSAFLGKSWSRDGQVFRFGVRMDRLEDAFRPKVASSSKQTLVPDDEAIRAVFRWERPGRVQRTLVAWYGHSERLIKQLRDLPSPTRSTDTSLDEMGVRELWRGSMKDWRWTLGGELRLRENLEATQLAVGGDIAPEEQGEPIEDGSQRALAVFGSATRELGPFELSAGLRFEPIETEAFFGGRTRDTSDNAWAGSVSLLRRSEKSGVWRAQIARSFRVPTITDRYLTGITGRGFKLASPELDPESALQLDLGWHIERGRWRVSASAFHYEIDDVLVRDFLEEELYRFVNGGEASVEGLELGARVRLGKGAELDFSAHHVRGEEESGRPLASIPSDGFRIHWRQRLGERAWLRTELLAYERDERPGSGEVETAGFGLVNVSAGYTLRPGLSVRAALRNALDQPHAISARDSDPPAPGRHFVMALRWAR